MFETLVIAPSHPDLAALPDEAANIAAAMNGRVLTGNLSLRNIMDHIEGKRYVRLWIAGHASIDGVPIADDKLTPMVIAWICNLIGAEELVINTCSSESFVLSIQGTADVDVLYSVQDVPDAEAWLMARAIAQQYPKTQDLNTAVTQVTRGSGLYRYIRHANRVNSMDRSQLSNGQMVRQVLQNQVHVEDLLRRIKALEDRAATTIINQSPSASHGNLLIITTVLVAIILFILIAVSFYLISSRGPVFPALWLFLP